MKHLMLFAAGLSVVLAALTGCAPTRTGSAVSSEVPSPAPAPTVAEGRVKLFYEGNAQVELIGPSGRRVLVDVYSPATLSGPPTTEDILLTTHTHRDHINDAFLKVFPGTQLFTKADTITRSDVTVTGIAAAHNAGDTPQPEGGTDYIYVIDLGGLRFAHFGDIGQDVLTEEQLATLGHVDVAIMQLDNSYSAMNVENRKGFNLMAQLQPRLIIPTHNSAAASTIAGETWSALFSEQDYVSIGRDELTDETRILFMGSNARTHGNAAKATQVEW